MFYFHFQSLLFCFFIFHILFPLVLFPTCYSFILLFSVIFVSSLSLCIPIGERDFNLIQETLHSNSHLYSVSVTICNLCIRFSWTNIAKQTFLGRLRWIKTYQRNRTYSRFSKRWLQTWTCIMPVRKILLLSTYGGDKVSLALRFQPLLNYRSSLM